MAPLEPVGLRLDREQGGLADQLYAQLRQRLLAGQAGGRLPATRVLAEQLGVSRNTVLAAYERLAGEGYLQGRAGAGSQVQLRANPQPQRQTPAGPRSAAALPDHPSWSELPMAVASGAQGHPFRLGLPPLDLFPFATWARLQRQFWRRAEREGLGLGYADAAGLPRLRELLAAWLRSARGLRCEAEQVLVTSGAQQGFALAALALLQPGDRVAVEMPGYHGQLAALRLARANTIGVPVDRDGLRPAALAVLGPACKLLALSPSQQWPTGVSLSLERRLELLAWARRQQAWLIEDDYAGEYRFDGLPLPALASLDVDGRCVYVGSFSKLLAPGLRLGYLVLPPALLPALRRLRAAMDRQPPLADQHVLADFIERGGLQAHLRRLRRAAAGRRQALLQAWSEHFGQRWPLQAPPAGLSVHLPLELARQEALLLERARSAGLGAGGVQELIRHCGQPSRRAGLVLGFGAATEAQLREGVAGLAKAWAGL